MQHQLTHFDYFGDKALTFRLVREEDRPSVEAMVADPSTANAIAEDPATLLKEFRRLWAEGDSAPDLRHFVVVDSAGAIVAYLRLLHPFAVPQSVWLAFLVVAPACRGKGVGRRILRLLVDGARAIPGIQRVGMHCRVSNPRAVHLYGSEGFACVKREPWAESLVQPDERLTLVRELACAGSRNMV